MIQFFKGDQEEVDLYNDAAPVMDQLSADRDAFFEQAYSSYLLGEVIYDSGRSPLSNAIPRRIFRESFAAIFEAFTAPGTAETYLTVFRAIFGENVDVEFTVPAPGKLVIDIEASGILLSNLNARRIEDNVYLYDRIVTHDGDYIMLQTVKGFESQYELEQMLKEMVPAGIWTDINLSVAG